MSNFNIGDTVRIGKGKVEYTVSAPQDCAEGFTNVQSNNTGKTQTVSTDRLVLVSAKVEQEFIALAEESAAKHVTVPEFYNIEGEAGGNFPAGVGMPIAGAESPVESTEDAPEAETFDPRTDRRQSAYGLSILAAVLRKNPNAARLGVNPFKPIGSTRAKVRKAVKAKRTAMHKANATYNALRRAA